MSRVGAGKGHSGRVAGMHASHSKALLSQNAFKFASGMCVSIQLRVLHAQETGQMGELGCCLLRLLMRIQTRLVIGVYGMNSYGDLDSPC